MFKIASAFVIAASEFGNEVYKIGFVRDHRSTMSKKKQPRDMTNDEAIRHLFHPKIVKHVKSLVNETNLKVSKKATK